MTNPIIVALDVASAQEAMSLVRRLGDSVAMYKVGLELHTAAGRPFVDELRAEGRGIFLDLKLLRPAPAGSNRVDQLRPARPRRSGHLQDRGRSGGTARPQSARRRDGRHCLFPLEAAAMRRMLGPDKLLVVSGIRSAGVEAGDQKRVATPRQAVQAGASYLVVGRQITRATGPRAEALRILAEIE